VLTAIFRVTGLTVCQEISNSCDIELANIGYEDSKMELKITSAHV